MSVIKLLFGAISFMLYSMTISEIETAPYVIDGHLQTNVTTALNQPMLLDCPIMGKPKVDIAWFRNGEAVSQIGDFFILMNGSLHRPISQLTDGGEYICEGTNTLGVARTPSISVTIASKCKKNVCSQYFS
jgi:hypothetical protein